MGNASTRPPDDTRHPQFVASAPADRDHTSVDGESESLSDGESEQLSDGDADNQSSSDTSPDTEKNVESPGQAVATEIQPSPSKEKPKSPIASPSVTPVPSAQTRKRSKRLESQSCELLVQENQQLREAVAAEIALQASIKAILYKRELKIAQLEKQLDKLKNEISH